MRRPAVVTFQQRPEGWTTTASRRTFPTLAAAEAVTGGKALDGKAKSQTAYKQTGEQTGRTANERKG